MTESLRPGFVVADDFDSAVVLGSQWEANGVIVPWPCNTSAVLEENTTPASHAAFAPMF